MNINQAVQHMVDGGKVRLDYWEEDEYITIKNGEFIDNWEQEFVMSPFMFEERFIVVK
jgi:hypothetical protein